MAAAAAAAITPDLREIPESLILLLGALGPVIAWMLGLGLAKWIGLKSTSFTLDPNIPQPTILNAENCVCKASSKNFVQSYMCVTHINIPKDCMREQITTTPLQFFSFCHSCI